MRRKEILVVLLNATSIIERSRSARTKSAATPSSVAFNTEISSLACARWRAFHHYRFHDHIRKGAENRGATGGECCRRKTGSATFEPGPRQSPWKSGYPPDSRLPLQMKGHRSPCPCLYSDDCR